MKWSSGWWLYHSTTFYKTLDSWTEYSEKFSIVWGSISPIQLSFSRKRTSLYPAVVIECTFQTIYGTILHYIITSCILSCHYYYHYNCKHKQKLISSVFLWEMVFITFECLFRAYFPLLVSFIFIFTFIFRLYFEDLDLDGSQLFILLLSYHITQWSIVHFFYVLSFLLFFPIIIICCIPNDFSPPHIITN